MFKQIGAVLLLVLSANANLIGWGDCGSDLAYVNQIRIANCTHTPCQFIRGQQYLIEVDATSRANSNELPFAAVASILGIDFTMMEGDACNKLRVGSCPARIGESFTFSVVFEVPQLLPPISTVVVTTLWTDFGQIGVCVSVAVQLR